MPDTVELRKPQAFLTDGTPIDQLIVRYNLPMSPRLMGAPFALVKTHVDAVGARGTVKVRPTASNAITRAAAYQSTMFEGGSGQIGVSANDGTGNELALTGYISQPRFDVSFGSTGASVAIVHPIAILETLNTSIYRSDDSIFQDVPPESLMNDNPAAVMKSVLERMIENTDLEDGNDADIKKNIHTKNQEALNIWYSILDASELEIPNLSDVDPEKLIQAIMDVYLGSNGDFLNVIASFQLQFQMMLIPNMESEGNALGKFIHLGEQVTMESTDKKVNIDSINISAGISSLLPVTQVAMRGIPEIIFQENVNKINIRESEIGAWPLVLPETGRTEIVTALPWMPTEVTTRSISPSSDAMDLAVYKAIKNSEKAAAQKIKEAYNDTAIWWCKNHYINTALVSAGAQISVPLDFSWTIGLRYKIQDENDVLFTGFLMGIEHTLQSSPRAATANTSLYFSHVELGSFELPNKE